MRLPPCAFYFWRFFHATKRPRNGTRQPLLFEKTPKKFSTLSTGRFPLNVLCSPGRARSMMSAISAAWAVRNCDPNILHHPLIPKIDYVTGRHEITSITPIARAHDCSTGAIVSRRCRNMHSEVTADKSGRSVQKCSHAAVYSIVIRLTLIPFSSAGEPKPWDF